MAAKMANVGFGEGRCRQVRKDSKEPHQLRLKTPLFAAGNEALTDKRAGGSGVGGGCSTGTPRLGVRLFPLWGCSLHEWL